jgi:ABC-2 type transport system permease protein
MTKGLSAIYRKEIGSFFNSSIAYVFLILFVLIPNLMFFFFFGGIFKEGVATMRSFFMLLPFVFIVFIPGLTMGSWAREKKTEQLNYYLLSLSQKLRYFLENFSPHLRL